MLNDRNNRSICNFKQVEIECAKLQIQFLNQVLDFNMPIIYHYK